MRIRRSRRVRLAVVAGNVERVYSEEGKRREGEQNLPMHDASTRTNANDNNNDMGNDDDKVEKNKEKEQKNDEETDEYHPLEVKDIVVIHAALGREVRRRRHRRRREREPIRRFSYVGLSRRSERKNREERFV